MIKRSDIIWEHKPYLRVGQTNQYEFHLWLNRPLADWDVFDEWERVRTRSMRQHLRNGDILFDIGAEMGWLSVIYGQMVGASNMVLFEPTAEFWPNIEALWHKNFDAEPLDTVNALVGNKPQGKIETGKWPECSNGDLIEKLSYTLIHENPKQIPTTTIDEYIYQTGITPTALTIDTEGSELLILQGAKDILAKRNLKVWVSVHPDLALKDYGVESQYAVYEFMKEQGYEGSMVGQDHEQHYYFYRG